MGSFDFYITCAEDFEPSVPSHKSHFWLEDVEVCSSRCADIHYEQKHS